MNLLRNVGEVFDRVWGLGDWLAAVQALCSLEGLRAALAALAASWLIACTLLASLRLSRSLLPAAGIPLRWSVCVTSGMWLATLGFHALRSLGAFTLPWALLGCGALLFASRRLLLRQTTLAYTARRELRAARAIVRLVRREGRLLPGLFVAVLALIGLRGLIVPPLGWDFITYHGPRAAHWLQDGQFTFAEGVGPYDLYRHFFAGGEVFAAWEMLPFRSDLLVNLGGLAQWLGLAVSGWALARAIGLRGRRATLAPAIVALAPLVQLQVNAGYVELPLNAALVGGIALALQGLRRPRAGVVIACALSLGVAAGVKLPGALAGATVACAFVLRWLGSRTERLRHKLIVLAAGACVAVLPVLPFLLRALRDTGYPLSPMPVRILGFSLGVASPAMAWYQQRGLAAHHWPSELPALLRLIKAFANWNETLAAIALLPWLLAPLGLWVLARRQPLAAAALGAAIAAGLLAHFSLAMTSVRMLRVGSAARFLISAFALVVPLSLLGVSRARVPLGSIYSALLLLYALGGSLVVARLGWGKWEVREIALVAIVLALLGAAWRGVSAARRGLSGRLPLAVVCLCGALACAALQLRRDRTRAAACEHSFALHKQPRYWAPAIRLIDRPERSERIALTSGPNQSSDHWFHYFLFGQRFQNTIHYVPPTRDGRVAHWGSSGGLASRADFPSWLARLGAERITHVMSFEPRSIEQDFMDAAPRHFEKLTGDRNWGLYRVRAP